MMLDDGTLAAVTFDLGGQPVSLALPIGEVTSLLTVCVALVAQSAEQRPAEEAQVLEVDDWEVGRTTSGAVIVRLAGENGASLSYRMARHQALQLRSAITMATASPPRETAHVQQVRESDPRPATLHLAALIALREQCRDSPAALQMVEGCLALLAELDAANDEGRAVYLRNLLELVSAAREDLSFLEGLAARNFEKPTLSGR